MDRATILRAVEAIGAEADQSNHLQLLEAAGFSASEATALADVLPEAFAVPILEHLGVCSVDDVASALTRSGKRVRIQLSQSEIFCAALSLAREHFETGAMEQDAFRAIASQSSLVDAANKALNVGDSLEGASVAIAFIGASAESLGYRPWYRRFFSRS